MLTSTIDFVIISFIYPSIVISRNTRDIETQEKDSNSIINVLFCD